MKLAVPVDGASPVCFLRKLFFVFAFSDFGWFPSLAIDTVEAFFFRENLDPLLGRLVCELFRGKTCVVGLPVGDCAAEEVLCRG